MNQEWHTVSIHMIFTLCPQKYLFQLQYFQIAKHFQFTKFIYTLVEHGCQIWPFGRSQRWLWILTQKSPLSRRSLCRWIIPKETCFNASFSLKTCWYNDFHQSICCFVAVVWCHITAWRFYVDDLIVNCTITRIERRHQKSAKISPLDRRWQRWKIQRIWQLCCWMRQNVKRFIVCSFLKILFDVNACSETFSCSKLLEQNIRSGSFSSLIYKRN